MNLSWWPKSPRCAMTCPTQWHGLNAVQEIQASKGLKANEWIDQVKAVLSGAKGGGREDNAQASGKGIAQA